MNATPAQRIEELSRRLPGGVTLVAVSKFHPVEAILSAYSAGQRVFGESRAQELAAKAPELPDDIQWHFIGHLQTNKVKTVVPLAHTIQSIDSLAPPQSRRRRGGKDGTHGKRAFAGSCGGGRNQIRLHSRRTPRHSPRGGSHDRCESNRNNGHGVKHRQHLPH